MAKKNDYLLTLNGRTGEWFPIGEASIVDNGDRVKLIFLNWSVVFDGTSMFLVPNEQLIAKELRHAAKQAATKAAKRKHKKGK